MPPEVAPAPSRSRQRLFAGLALLTILAATEVASIAIHGLLYGASHPPVAGGEAERDRESEAVPGERAAGIRKEVLHPYLGYVLEPVRAGRESGLANLGFRFGGSRIDVFAQGDDYRVAIVGGSVAAQFSLGPGGETLAAGLRATCQPGRTITIVPLALAGYKQPQQLMTIAYFLSLGGRFDMVINIDGFNDVVLPAAEQSRLGVFPFYPRMWSARVGGLDEAHLQLAAEIRELQGRQASVHRAASGPLRWSPTIRLVTRRYGEHLARRHAQLKEAFFLDEQAKASSYLASGPKRTYPDDLAMLADQAASWARASLQLHRLCQANGIAYHHFLQPNQYVPGSKTLTDEERAKAFLPDSSYARWVKLGYPRLREQGAHLPGMGVSYHDMTDVFVDRPETIYVDTCCHMNDAGNVALARLMLRAICPSVSPGD